MLSYCFQCWWLLLWVCYPSKQSVWGIHGFDHHMLHLKLQTLEFVSEVKMLAPRYFFLNFCWISICFGSPHFGILVVVHLFLLFFLPYLFDFARSSFCLLLASILYQYVAIPLVQSLDTSSAHDYFTQQYTSIFCISYILNQHNALEK